MGSALTGGVLRRSALSAAAWLVGSVLPLLAISAAPRLSSAKPDCRALRALFWMGGTSLMAGSYAGDAVVAIFNLRFIGQNAKSVNQLNGI